MSHLCCSSRIQQSTASDSLLLSTEEQHTAGALRHRASQDAGITSKAPPASCSRLAGIPDTYDFTDTPRHNLLPSKAQGVSVLRVAAATGQRPAHLAAVLLCGCNGQASQVLLVPEACPPPCWVTNTCRCTDKHLVIADRRLPLAEGLRGLGHRRQDLTGTLDPGSREIMEAKPRPSAWPDLHQREVRIQLHTGGDLGADSQGRHARRGSPEGSRGSIQVAQPVGLPSRCPPSQR